MKTFNTIQIVVLLMSLPTLLNLCYNASFTGAQVLFWVGLIATFILAIYSGLCIRESMD